MLSFRPLRIGLWDPFQMAFPWLASGGDPNNLITHSDDPPSTPWKINIEHKNGGLVQMMFLCNWVVFRFNILIFRGVL